MNNRKWDWMMERLESDERSEMEHRIKAIRKCLSELTDSQVYKLYQNGVMFIGFKSELLHETSALSRLIKEYEDNNLFNVYD